MQPVDPSPTKRAPMGALALACWTVAALLFGCSSEDSKGELDTSESIESSRDSKRAPGVHVRADVASLHTETFSLEPGQERFLCFAATLEQDLVIDGYDVGGRSFLHHLVFVRALAPEPEGTSECNILFRQTWDPLFLAGAGASKLDFPAGLGHLLKAGTQLVAQLHLLNTSATTVTDSIEVAMHRSKAQAPRPVGAFVFGTQDLHLPAARSSTVEATCSPDQPVQIFAAFPHMHLLGTAMSFEVGRSVDALQKVFARDPYDFDDQYIDLIDLTLQPGDVARVRCSYDNTLDHEVTFGESTTNEMCFFVGFSADNPGLQTCLNNSGARSAR